MLVTILGSAGGAPAPARETSCILVRDRDRVLLLDVGTGARRLLADDALLAGVTSVDVVLTHFHFDHIAGLPYLQWVDAQVAIWAPGEWLYQIASTEILAPLRRPPISPNDVTGGPVNELREGVQTIGGFNVRASAQLHHWEPSVGLRVEDDIAYITDTPFVDSSVSLARGVRHLLHEAWSTSSAPQSLGKDATAAEAARVARDAGVGDLTLIHLNRRLDVRALLDDARPIFPRVAAAEDGMVLEFTN